MTDAPVLFSGPMVRALLEGRKSQTRRLAWHDAELGVQDHASEQLEDMELRGWDAVPEGSGFRVYKPTRWKKIHDRFQAGEPVRLWVKEAVWLRDIGSFGRTKHEAIYKATDEEKARSVFRQDAIRWRPSPRWASRLTLVVTGAKIERLLDISEEDARAEGFADGSLNDGWPGPRQIPDAPGWTMQAHDTLCSAVGMFQIAWSELHPDWDGYSSPWVVALTFRVVKQNIDDMEV